MPDARERIAKLEERSETQQWHIDALSSAIDNLAGEIRRINQKLDRHMGFLGGIAFAFSLIGACIGTVGSLVMRKVM